MMDNLLKLVPAKKNKLRAQGRTSKAVELENYMSNVYKKQLQHNVAEKSGMFPWKRVWIK